MSKYKYLIIAIVVLIAAAGAWITLKPEKRPDSMVQDGNLTLVFADEEHMKCEQDSDCIMVSSDCNNCSGVQIINKAFEAEFEAKKNKICSEAPAGTTTNKCINMIKGTKCSDQGICIGYN